MPAVTTLAVFAPSRRAPAPTSDRHPTLPHPFSHKGRNGRECCRLVRADRRRPGPAADGDNVREGRLPVTAWQGHRPSRRWNHHRGVEETYSAHRSATLQRAWRDIPPTGKRSRSRRPGCSTLPQVPSSTEPHNCHQQLMVVVDHQPRDGVQSRQPGARSARTRQHGIGLFADRRYSRRGTHLNIRRRLTAALRTRSRTISCLSTSRVYAVFRLARGRADFTPGVVVNDVHRAKTAGHFSAGGAGDIEMSFFRGGFTL